MERLPLTEQAVREALAPHKRFGAVLEVHPVVESTNDVARSLADAGAPEGTVVLADRQTGGRGRHGRTWYSPADCNLYLSVVLRPPLPPTQAPLLALTAAVAVAEVVREHAGVDVQLKWPNDVLADGRKLAGILAEMAARGGEVAWVVLGIGINVNLEAGLLPPELLETATSLRLCSGRTFDRAVLCAELLQALERWTARFYVEGAAPVLEAWRQRSCTLGQAVRIRDGERVIEGMAVDVDLGGALVVQPASGERVHVLTGEVD